MQLRVRCNVLEVKHLSNFFLKKSIKKTLFLMPAERSYDGVKMTSENQANSPNIAHIICTSIRKVQMSSKNISVHNSTYLLGQ